MSYWLHPGARDDLDRALTHYGLRAGPQIARRFYDEFERVARLLVERPGLGTPLAGGRRVFPLQVFPYSVVYRKAGSGIQVLVIRHQHRRPGYGNARR